MAIINNICLGCKKINNCKLPSPIESCGDREEEK